MKNSQRISSGVNGLDELIDGGFPPGRVILATGEPGSGKTIFAVQYLIQGITEHDHNGVFVCMEEAKPDLYREMNLFGWDLETHEKNGKLAFVDATPLRLVPSRLKVGDLAIDRKDFTTTTLMQAIKTAAERIHATRISVDSLTSLSLQYQDIYQKRIATLDLVGALANTGATSLVTSELKSPGLKRSLQPEEFLSHGVIVMQNMRVGTSLTRVLQIMKMRETACDNQPRPYRITNHGIEVYPSETIFK